MMNVAVDLATRQLAAVPAPPMALLAELTHRCPLRCLYCSNPVTLLGASNELPTEVWLDLIDQAVELGVLQIHFSGGEPMARRDLTALIAHAAKRQLYSNLITSGIQITASILDEMAKAGLDHIQLSFQDAEAEGSERIGGLAGAHQRKLQAARLIHDAGFPLTLNFVVHRQNLSRLPEMLEMGVALGAGRVEIAHTQYYGWGLLNRDALLPTSDQLDRATEQVEAARERLKDHLVIDYVIPDYHADRPKACMGGWAQRFVVISPNGTALPCHAAETIPGLVFPSIRNQRLADVWRNDPAFQRFRGSDWMGEPCRSCVFREQDFGGCRCQALALAQDAAAADPVCPKSTRHDVVVAAIAAARDDAPVTYRSIHTGAVVSDRHT